MPTILRQRQISPLILRKAEGLGLTPLQARIVAARIPEGDVDVLQTRIWPRLADLSSPELLPDIDMAADRIAQAVIDRETVIINTDFDADGVSGNCVLQSAFLDTFRHPPERLHSVIGLRLRDGYGVSSNVTDRIISIANGPALVITADQGSADQERIARMRELGIETVVTDHHEIPEAGPPRAAVACVNPTRRDSAFPDRFVAGVHVAFLVMAVVRQRLIELQYLSPDAPRLSQLADFVALGTTAMP